MLYVVIPCYNEKENVAPACEAIGGCLGAAGISHVLLFVDDGSADGTFDEINSLRETKPNVAGIKFSRNFGKEAALFAGIKHAAARPDMTAIATIDADLQHPPELLPRMHSLLSQGYDIVDAVKKSRGKEGALHRAFTKLFYGTMAKSDRSLERIEAQSDCKMLSKNAADALVRLPERLTFYRALAGWIGFSHTEVEFDVRERERGVTKFSFTKLLRYALANISGFTAMPMQFITVTGGLFGVIALVFGIISLAQYFLGISQPGFTTVILLILVTGAFIMSGMGIIGYYVSKIYEEVKLRPRYIIEKEVSAESAKASSGVHDQQEH